MDRTRKKYIVSAIVFIVLAILIIVICRCNNFEYVDIVTYEGIFVSIFGVVLTFMQVLEMQTITESTQKAVEDTKKHIDLILSISDISKNIVYLRLVKEYITNDKYELARIRLSDSKDFFAGVPYIQDIQGLNLDVARHKKIVASLNMDLNSLDDQINEGQGINKKVFCEDIEKVVSFLIDVENKLRTKE